MINTEQLLAEYARIVLAQPTQAEADRMAAVLWQTVAVAAPGDAARARRLLESAATARSDHHSPCLARFDDQSPTYTCTRDRGHDGWHEAKDTYDGAVMHAWTPAPAPSSQAGLASIRRSP